jgi:hypothetical protein
MTPKEKAQELFDRFNQPDRTNYPYVHNAQQCALIAVDEVLEATKKYDFTLGPNPSYNSYWLNVKQQIELL